MSDRSDVVQKATRLINRGDLKEAARIYARLFREDSRDWSVGNTLGDLYVRLGNADAAVSHFTVLAEQLAADGFAAKSRALYRKILRIEPANALARQRVDELDKPQAGQTSPFLQRVLETARTLRETEPATVPAKLAHADETPPQPAPSDETPPNAAQPDSAPLPSVAAAAAAPAPPIAAGLPFRPGVTETPVRAAPSPLTSGPAQMPQSQTEWAEEWAAVMSPPRPAATRSEPGPPPPARHGGKGGPPAQVHAPAPSAASAIAGTAPADTAREPSSDAAGEFRMMEAEADAAGAQHDFRAAAAMIEDFLTARPHHIAALEKLIELGVDGGLGTQLVVAQVRLTEACLREERFSQAYRIVEDLIARHPESASHRTLLDRVRSVAREHGLTFAPLAPRDEEAVPPATETQPPAAPLPVQEPSAVRILRPDFTEVAETSRSKPEPTSAEKEDVPSPPAGPLADLLKDLGDPEHAFDDIRDALLEEAAAGAEERFAEATRCIDAGQLENAARALEEAMCAPHLRAPAGSRLARIYREQGAAMEALTCLEWVAEIPPSSEESGHELAYELALTLEVLGQHAQALGLYRELLAEVGSGYRDVAARVQRLGAA